MGFVFVFLESESELEVWCESRFCWGRVLSFQSGEGFVGRYHVLAL